MRCLEIKRDADGNGTARRRGIRLAVRRMIRSEVGAAAIEFAFIGPIVILMLIAVIEFGRMFYTQANLQYTVDEAGRAIMAHFTREYFIESDSANCYAKAGEVPTAQEFSDLTTCATAQVSNYISPNVVGFDENDIDVSTTVPVAPTTTGGNSVPGFIRIRLNYSYNFIIPVPYFGWTGGMPLHAETRVPLIWYRS